MSTLRLGRRQMLVTATAFLAGTTFARGHNGTVHVTIENLAFTPSEIEVKPGETIEWTNMDAFAHTATAKGGWEVMIPPGQVATHVATDDDGVDYYCRYHPNMTGRIKIVP